MGFYSAQLNDKGIVIAIVDSPEKIIGSRVVQINSFDASIAGKKYDSEKHSFEDVPKTEGQLVEEAIQAKIIQLKKQDETTYRPKAIEALQADGILTANGSLVAIAEEG